MGAAIVSGCDTPSILELGEEALDLVAPAIERFVVGIRGLPGFYWIK